MKSEKFSTRFLKWGTYSRFKTIQRLAWKRIEPKGQIFSTSGSALRILVGGDVTFDHELRVPIGGVYRSTARANLLLQGIKRKMLKTLCKYFFSPKYLSSRSYNSYTDLSVRRPESKRQRLLGANHPLIPFNIDYSSDSTKFAYPFEKIAPLFKEKDLVLINLETPLSNHSRVQGHFICDPRYAQALKDAGISIVTLANNHVFDAGDIGFSDTLNHLEAVGIPYTGGGKNFKDARSGEHIEIKGLKIGFLGYTNFCNKKFISVAAEYPGILPLDPQLIVEDIKVAKEKSDFVFVSLHWGFEDQPNIHPRQIEIAHLLIDAGADAIIGHHPHIPHGIEIYKGRPVLYSLGNLIFGFSTNHWSDNYLAEIVIDQKRIRGVLIHPVSGRGPELFQPEALSGVRADSLLHDLQIKSVGFNTAIVVQNHIGYINIPYK